MRQSIIAKQSTKSTLSSRFTINTDVDHDENLSSTSDAATHVIASNEDSVLDEQIDCEDNYI